MIKRPDTARGFKILPRRWVVEGTFAWLGRRRRLAKDWERSTESSSAWATVASIRVLTRRIATPSNQVAIKNTPIQNRTPNVDPTMTEAIACGLTRSSKRSTSERVSDIPTLRYYFLLSTNASRLAAIQALRFKIVNHIH
jgi:hypothetical protein